MMICERNKILKDYISRFLYFIYTLKKIKNKKQEFLIKNKKDFSNLTYFNIDILVDTYVHTYILNLRSFIN